MIKVQGDNIFKNCLTLTWDLPTKSPVGTSSGERCEHNMCVSIPKGTVSTQSGVTLV